jgi:ABC-2 type transport system permease protein
LTLSFIVPIAFFSIFAGIFGSRSGGTDPIRIAVVDEDQSELSRRLVQALQAEGGLRVETGPATAKESAAAKKFGAGSAPAGGPAPRLYDTRAAEAAVRAGDFPVAIVIPKGFGLAPIGFGPTEGGTKLQILNDSSDPIAAQVVYGLLQKAAMVSMPDAMAAEGTKYLDKASGGLTGEQRARVEQSMRELRAHAESQAAPKGGPADGSAAPKGAPGGSAAPKSGALTGLVSAEIRDVVGENKKNPVVAFYAAGIGVMFLLFSAAAAGGAILDESESGTLDRILSSRVTMTTLLLGKLTYAALLGFAQLTVMFLWGALAFQVELFKHLGGFVVMASVTALASAGLGLALASACKTRAQLSALTTLVVLTMSALGGSMVPRFIMPDLLQRIGLVTFNAWALDGFTKIFWREEPVSHVWPQVLVLLGAVVLFFAIARRLARRWEVA